MKGLSHLLHQASTLARSGKTLQAQTLYRRILKLLPQHARAHEGLAQLFLSRSDPLNALPHLQSVCAAEPHVGSHWVRWVHALRLLGEPLKAQEVLDQAAQQGLDAALLDALQASLSQPPLERQRHVLWQYQQGHVLTAEIAARLFMGDYPEHPLGWQILGALLHDSGRLQEALEVKQETVQRFEQDANAHNNLAHTQLALGQYQGALNSARQALLLNPNLAQARSHEVLALRALRSAQVRRA